MAGIFVLGGCKSGKSSVAQKLAEKISPDRVYLATGKPTDAEMIDRIIKHQEDRGEGWSTIEADTDLVTPLKECSYNQVILIDCITAWITNLLMIEASDEEIIKKTEEFGAFLRESKLPVIMVSNEVGYGIVPVNNLARRFRDIAGIVNQKLASFSDNVVMTVAGIPQNIKGKLEF